MKSVYCAVRTGPLNKNSLRFVFKGLINLFYFKGFIKNVDTMEFPPVECTYFQPTCNVEGFSGL
jgi:hypothetical protein